MADVISTALFRALGDFSGLVNQSERARRALAATESQAERTFGARLQRNLAARSGQMQQFGRGATMSVTAPIVAAGAVMVNTYSQFEKTLTEAAGKADATRKEFAQMERLAIKMGQQTMFSAGEAASALDNLAALGMTARQSMEALPGVLLAAQASGEDLALTADVVAKSMNAFGIEAKDAGRVADVFAQAANTTSLDMQKIAEGMAHAGQLGARWGYTLEDVTAVLGRLTDMGVPAASAGVALRQAIVSLSAPAAKQSALLDKLGISTRDAKGQMLPLPDLMEELANGLNTSNDAYKSFTKTAGMNEEQLKEWAAANGFTTTVARDIQAAAQGGGEAMKDMALKTLFGVEGSKAIGLAISDNKPVILDAQRDTEKLADLTDGLAETMGVKAAKAWVKARTENGKFTASGADAVRALGAMNRSAEGTAKTFAERLGETTAAQIDQIQGSLETMAIVLVKRFAPAVKDALKWVTRMVNAFVDWSQEHDTAMKWIGWAVLFAAAIGPVAWVLGTIGRGIAFLLGIGRNLIHWFRVVVLKAQILAWTLGIATGWIWAAVAAAAALVAGIVLLWKKNEGFREFVKGAWRAIGRFVQRAWEDVIKPALKAFWSWIREVLWPAIQDLYEKVIRPIFRLIGRVISRVWDQVIKPAFRAWSRYLREVLGPAISWLWRKVIKPTFGLIGRAVKNHWERFSKPALSAFAKFLEEKVGPAVSAFWRDYVRPTFDRIRKRVKTVLDDHVVPALERLREKIETDVVPAVRLMARVWARNMRRMASIAEEQITEILRVFEPFIRMMNENVVKAAVFMARTVIWWVAMLEAGIKRYMRLLIPPHLRFMGDKFRDLGLRMEHVYQFLMLPVLLAFGPVLRDLVFLFSRAKRDIGSVWEGLAAVIAAPINLAIGYVNMLIANYNRVAKFFGAPQAPSLSYVGSPKRKTPKGVKEGPSPYTGDRRGLARGGVIGGGQSRSYDTVTADLRPLEGVVVPEAVDMLGGEPGIHALNRLAEKRRKFGRLHGRPSFASGGVNPLPGGAVTNRHGSPYYGAWYAADYNKPGNDLGAPVVAWKSGTVSRAHWGGEDGSYGNTVSVQHAGQWTRYAHLLSILVRAGQRVAAGQPIGKVGSTGNSSGPHLHFEIHGGTSPIGGGSSGLSIPPAIAALMSVAGMLKGANLGALKGPVGALGKNALVRMATMAASAGFGATGQTLDALTGGPLRRLVTDKLLDSGGTLAPGWNRVFNGTGENESVFTARQMAALLGSADASRIAAQRMTAVAHQSYVGDRGRRGDVTIIVNNPVPERAGRSVGKVLRGQAVEAGWVA